MADEPIGPPRADRTERSELEYDAVLASPSPFVGRRAELAELSDGLDAASLGHGRLFVVAGEPGIGKTRLATEFANAAQARGALVYWGRCWEAGGTPPYWPWIELIRQIVRDEGPAIMPPLGRHAVYLEQLVPELESHRGQPRDAAPPPADPESARFFIFDAVAALIREVATRRPLVVIVEDIHAADKVSVLLLAFLSRALLNSAVVLVGTYRDVEARMSPPLLEPLAELARQARRLTLRGLTAEEVGRLVESAAGQTASEASIARIHGVTDGNPFFIDELVRLLGGEGRLGGQAGLPGALGVPDGVRDAVRRRLEPLSHEGRSLLEIAAVAGREFDVAVLRLALGVDPVVVIQGLDEPARHGLVVPVRGVAGRFAFRHALIREVIFESVPLARRLVLHRRLAMSLETLAGGDSDRHVAALAHHSLESAPSGDDDRFVEHAVEAARHAMRRMAFEEAVEIYQRTIDAVAHVAPDERRLCKLLISLGEAKEWANDAAGSRDAAEQAASIARRLGASDLLARAALGVGAVEALKFTASSRCDGAPGLLREALEMVAPADVATRARLRARLAMHCLSQGARSEALESSAQAIADARDSADRDVLAHALLARHGVLLGPDHLDERCAIAAELLDIGTALGSREFVMRSHALRAANFFDLGDISALDRAIAVHERFAGEAADPFERWVNLMWRSTRALVVGDFTEAERFSRMAFALSRTVPGPHAFEINGPMAYDGQRILIQEARYDGVPDPDLIDRYRALYPEVAVWHVAHLHRLTRLGRVSEVRATIDTLTARNFTEFERNATWLAAMSFLAESIALVGDRERATLLYGILLPYADHNATVIMMTSRGCISRPLGLLAATMGCRSDAIHHFETALRRNRRMGARAQVAITLLEFACAIHAGVASRDDAGRAEALCREALSIATDLGMTGLVDRCGALLDALLSPLGENARSDDFRLEKDGQFWVLSRADERIHLKDTKGLAYLSELIRYPNREIHVLELLAAHSSCGSREHPASATDSLQVQGTGMVDVLIDSRARQAYESRLDSLRRQLAAAEAHGDPEQALALRQEVASLNRELARAVGMGGRSRQSSAVERARISVTRAIRLALARIVDASPQLGGELARSIRTGTACRHAPSAPGDGNRAVGPERSRDRLRSEAISTATSAR